ncbi:geminin-like [Drosophila miranda]|uniref:geminin-like n=1 Tax=Drosophila miranda TaxID=7229 RepID=UPI00143F5FD4|nr:geminin-like [Drosophila miranda]XP_033253955.1 geminin-like [Drosophila miranda]
MSTGAARVYIQVESEAEQQEHLKQQRKTLKPLHGNVNEKENLSGRASIVDQLSRLKAGVPITPSTKYGKRKCVDTATAATSTKDANTQTEAQEEPQNDADKPITADDLTSECEPGENYYKLLAEQRRVALEDSLTENRHLHERIEGLEEEMDTMRQELDEAKNLVEVLKEICDEDTSEVEEDETEAAQN